MSSRLSAILKTAITVLAIACTWQGAAAQQSILGRVYTDVLNTPLVDATITLLNASGRELDKVVRSSSTGGFTIAAEPGRYRLRIRCVGCVPMETPIIEVPPKSTVQVKYSVSPVGVKLAAVKVTDVSKLERGRDGLQRCEQSKGQCLYALDFKDKATLPLYEILATVPGLQHAPDGHIRSLQGNRCLQFLVNRLPVTAVPETQIQPDGMFLTLYEMIPNSIDVAGIEIYRQFSEVPRELWQDAFPFADERGVTPMPGQPGIGRGSPMLACGLIVVWTRAAW